MTALITITVQFSETMLAEIDSAAAAMVSVEDIKPSRSATVRALTRIGLNEVAKNKGGDENGQ